MILYEKQKNETVKDYIYKNIKNNIMFLDLKPGDILSESELANKLEVSRTPIREVLIRLKEENLIEVKPQSGTYVSLIDTRLIDDAIFIRSNLEKQALNEACKNFPKEALLKMEKYILEQQLICKKKDNFLEFHRLDNKFHKLIFSAIGRENVWEIISNASNHYNRMRLLDEMNIDKNNLIEQHIKYFEIIKNKKIDDVEYVILLHIKEPIKHWELLMKNNSDIANYIK